MRVLKRTGDFEDVSFDKVLNRIKILSNDLSVDPYDVGQKVCSRIFDGVKTSELDELTAHICSSMIVDNPDYGVLASRIIVSNHHKNTSPSFSETIITLYNNTVDGEVCPLVSDRLYEVTMKNKEKLNSYINYDRDYTFDYFGFKTLERSYLIKVGDKIMERPAHMFMRVALGIHSDDLKEALQTYDCMSKKYFTHATPTLFNAGTPVPQMSSCFLLGVGDSIDSIFDTVKECAKISKHAGGIGMHIHSIRAKGSRIRSTNGKSDGIIPMLKVFNHVGRYINQCFTPDTIVYSKEGSKRMDEITTEDYLLTNDSTFKKVNSVSINEIEDETILEIRTKLSFEPVKVTKQHEIYVLKKGSTEPVFEIAENITTDDMVGYSIQTYEKDIEYYTADYCRFYAIMLIYGEINSKDYSVTTNENTLDFCQKYLKDKNIKYWTNHSKLVWCDDSIGITADMLNNIPENFLHLPKVKILSFIQNLFKNFKEDSFISSSYNLITSIKYLLLRLDIMTSGNKFDNEYVLTVSHENEYRTDTMIWTPIEYIKEIKYTGKVYDFNMMDNHNYTVASLGVVHNSGKRNGSIAIYLEPWHADVEAFLDLKKPHGNEEDRARDLFYALWVPDLFMKRVKEGGMWSLMCPDMCKGLSDVYGAEFEALYQKYEAEGRYIKQMPAQELWFKVMESQIESGVPYILFKDAANAKSNQKNLGVIKSSNLCVAGDTMILTSKGYYPIKDLHGQAVEIWNGEEFSETTIMKTGENQKLLTVKFDNGQEMKCTPYHKFHMENGILEANELEPGMQIIKYKLPESSEEYDVKIIIVEDNNESGDTYCFNESKKNRGIFNGVLAGNCVEIVEFTSPEETAVCNLASICLPTYIVTREDGTKYFDFEKLHEIAMLATKNLNKIIDLNYYPIEKARRSNMRHRPIGVGIQGLADTYIILRYPFDSPEAALLNKQIFETIYHGTVEASMLISKKRMELLAELKNADSSREEEIRRYLNLNEYETGIEGAYPGAYSSFVGSPASQGKLQFDLWNVDPGNERYDWTALKAEIVKYGIRNSLLVAPMPTASTSQIMGFTESFECITSNLYKRKTLAGEFVVVNKYLLNDLIKADLWDKEMRNKIMLGEGSIQNIKEIPEDLRALYKTGWEISQRVVIDQSADRGPFVCQSQSLNLFVEAPTFQILTSMLFHSFNRGLKSGCYYLRSKPRAKTQQFTIEPTFKGTPKKLTPVNSPHHTPVKKKQVVCDAAEGEACLVCGS